MLNKKLISGLQEDELKSVYSALLGRDPEENAIRASIEAGEELSSAISRVIASNEYLNRRANDFLLTKINDFVKDVQDTEITMIQTADSDKYRDLLFASGGFNAIYCSRYKINYELYIGIKYGIYPHHATFNRIKMLRDSVRMGRKGWIFYLDADNLIQDKEFDFRSLFYRLESEGKAFLFYNHHSEDCSDFDFWNINSGIFAVNLGDSLARSIIDIWASLYEDFYNKENYRDFRRWGDCINDQNSLQIILSNIDKNFPIKNKCHMMNFSDNVIGWFGRSEEDPSLGDVASRLSRLVSAGNSVYSEVKDVK